MSNQTTSNEATDVQQPNGEPLGLSASLGRIVRVRDGATEWMRRRRYWIDDMGESIDGFVGVVVADYRYLPGDDSHVSIDFETLEGIGVNPMWLDVC